MTHSIPNLSSDTLLHFTSTSEKFSQDVLYFGPNREINCFVFITWSLDGLLPLRLIGEELPILVEDTTNCYDDQFQYWETMQYKLDKFNQSLLDTGFAWNFFAWEEITDF